MAIEALKVNTKNSDFIWVRILSEKLDQESRRQWELDYPGKKLQTLQQLRDFINKRVQALEASSSVTTTRKVNLPITTNSEEIKRLNRRFLKTTRLHLKDVIAVQKTTKSLLVRSSLHSTLKTEKI